MTPLDTQQQFQVLLERRGIAHADAIADFMASQDVIEDPNKMARVLTVANLLPHQRRAALEHWSTIVDERQDS